MLHPCAHKSGGQGIPQILTWPLGENDQAVLAACRGTERSQLLAQLDASRPELLWTRWRVDLNTHVGGTTPRAAAARPERLHPSQSICPRLCQGGVRRVGVGDAFARPNSADGDPAHRGEGVARLHRLLLTPLFPLSFPEAGGVQFSRDHFDGDPVRRRGVVADEQVTQLVDADQPPR